MNLLNSNCDFCPYKRYQSHLIIDQIKVKFLVVIRDLLPYFLMVMGGVGLILFATLLVGLVWKALS